jgi:hypothetical protein
MVSKVIVGADTLRASGTVMKKLAKWLVEQEYVKSDDADLAIEQGSDAARDLPTAEKLSTLLFDLAGARHEPRGSDIEGRSSITKIEPGCILLQDDDDGKHYGPSEQATKLCRVGWTISGAVRKSGDRCVLVARPYSLLAENRKSNSGLGRPARFAATARRGGRLPSRACPIVVAADDRMVIVAE